MKKLFISAALLGLSFGYAKAQSFGIQAGSTFGYIKTEVGDEKNASKTKVGFTAGVVADFPIGTNFSIQPALNFVQKGGEEQEDGYDGDARYNYIELPVNFVYKVPNPSGAFFFGLGPTFSRGISGKEEYTMAGQTMESDVEFGDDANDDYKSMDIGANLLAGYMLNNGLSLAVNYNGGFRNMVHDDASSSGDVSMRAKYVGIRLIKMFGRTSAK